jgi:hypothetical protein
LKGVWVVLSNPRKTSPKEVGFWVSAEFKPNPSTTCWELFKKATSRQKIRVRDNDPKCCKQEGEAGSTFFDLESDIKRNAGLNFGPWGWGYNLQGQFLRYGEGCDRIDQKKAGGY